MRKDEYVLTKELRRLKKYGFLLQAKRVGYNEHGDYKYNILFTDDKSVLEPECDVTEIIGIINSLEICLGLYEAKLKEKAAKNLANLHFANSKHAPKRILTESGKNLFKDLRRLRMEFARKEGMPPYIIFNDHTLEEMCIYLPSNKKEMLAISGVGSTKYERYGEEFLEAISEFKRCNPDSVTSVEDVEECE